MSEGRPDNLSEPRTIEIAPPARSMACQARSQQLRYVWPMKIPADILAMLDRLVLVRDGKQIDDLNEKFLSVSSEVLGDQCLVTGHVIVWKRSHATFEEVEAFLESLDETVAMQVWEAATEDRLTRE